MKLRGTLTVETSTIYVYFLVWKTKKSRFEFLSKFLGPRQSPMCGNSICQDRRFLARYMPNLEAFFHYRNLDVSTLKELARRWNPKASEALVKSGQHLALADIHESIDELKHYRTHFLKLDS